MRSAKSFGLVLLVGLLGMAMACSSTTTHTGDGGSGGVSGGGGDAGKGSGGTGPCAEGGALCSADKTGCCTCGLQNCAEETQACWCNPDCVSILICAQGCDGGNCSVDGCTAAKPNGSSDFQKLRDCSTIKCKSECAP